METPSAQQIRESLIRSSRAQRQRPADAVLIHRGIRLPASLLRRLNTDWQRTRVIAVARTWAVLETRPTHRAVGLSAALLEDLPLIAPPEQIHLAPTARSPSKPTKLPPILLDDRLIAEETTTRFHLHASWPFSPTPIGTSIEPEALLSTILSCCAIHPGEGGFVAVCSALRRLAVPEGDRRRHRTLLEAEIKNRLLAELNALPARTPFKAVSRWTVANAEAGCESVGEARLLWLLRSSGIPGTKVQHVVAKRDQRYYLDIAIPELKIAIEFDGRGKYGLTEEDRVIAWSNQFERQEFLEDRGWTVLRVTWKDLDEPHIILGRVRVLIAERRRHRSR